MSIYKIQYQVTFHKDHLNVFDEHRPNVAPEFRKEKVVKDFSFIEANSLEDAKNQWLAEHKDSDGRLYQVLSVNSAN